MGLTPEQRHTEETFDPPNRQVLARDVIAVGGIRVKSVRPQGPPRTIPSERRRYSVGYPVSRRSPSLFWPLRRPGE